MPKNRNSKKGPLKSIGFFSLLFKISYALESLFKNLESEMDTQFCSLLWFSLWSGGPVEICSLSLIWFSHQWFLS